MCISFNFSPLFLKKFLPIRRKEIMEYGSIKAIRDMSTVPDDSSKELFIDRTLSKV
jgi:hypothetical protein